MFLPYLFLCRFFPIRQRFFVPPSEAPCRYFFHCYFASLPHPSDGTFLAHLLLFPFCSSSPFVCYFCPYNISFSVFLIIIFMLSAAHITSRLFMGYLAKGLNSLLSRAVLLQRQLSSFSSYYVASVSALNHVIAKVLLRKFSCLSSSRPVFYFVLRICLLFWCLLPSKQGGFSFAFVIIIPCFIYPVSP